MNRPYFYTTSASKTCSVRSIQVFNHEELKMSQMKIFMSWGIAALLLLISLSSSGQLVGNDTIDQAPVQEVRKGTTVQYSVSTGHIAGEQYSWEIVGGTPIPAANSGAGTAANPYVVNFTPNLHTISIHWGTDDQTIVGLAGLVRVQKRTNTGCISVVQSLAITRWSVATISITDADYILCSGDPTTDHITARFTGAPNFNFKYTIKNLDGTTSAEQIVTGVTTATANIPLPLNLVNPSALGDQTFVVTITQVNDSFTGDGTIVDGIFTITVHPAVSTGTIQASPVLQRR